VPLHLMLFVFDLECLFSLQIFSLNKQRQQ
jgi:hypothetical protein